ncbi:MAG: amylo-alpha-1,6-glucosidase [Syntrophothermus sp.]
MHREIEEARKKAIEVLLHNMEGPYNGLPRTAGWGYPEPYTRDLMISLLGIAVIDSPPLLQSMRRTLETLAGNQTGHGHIPSLVHDADDVGASDTTPLFLLALGIFRKVSGEREFLEESAQRALTWMAYQSPIDRYLVSQQPTSDWRDEQWVMGYGLYVNTLVYSYLRLFGQHKQAERLLDAMKHFTITGDVIHRHVHEGLVVPDKPYYALWSYKLYSSERFDLLGNSLAILAGIAPQSRAEAMIDWVEAECKSLKQKGDLALDLPPNFFPYVQPSDPDWHPRYEKFNQPGDYHNGGIWPFIAGFYIAALVAAKRYSLAEEKLIVLTEIVKMSNVSLNQDLEYGFNEWLKAQDGRPMGQNWQTWSAALYLYAARCVEERRTPFFEEIRNPAF